jgi:LysM repeat protein
LGATALIYLSHILIALKNFLVIFLLIFVYKPLRVFLRLFFYKVVVKFYSVALPFLKRIGWHRLDNTPFAVWTKQRLVHIFVIFITVVSIFVNLSAKTKANDLIDNTPKTILADLVQSEFSDNQDEGELIVESFDQEPKISDLQQSYLDNLSAMEPQLWVKNDNDEEVDEEMITIQNGSSLVKPEIATTQKTKRPRTENISYEVKPGDTISTIAEEFEISVTSILWENDLTAYSVIRPGDKLNILPSSGITHNVKNGDTLASIAKKYEVTEQDILTANKMVSAGSLQIAQKLFIPGGRKIYSDQPIATNRNTATKNTGYSVIKNFVKGVNAKPVAGNKMNWPTVGHRISQYFSWRHYAVDIANKIGTPIYAADSGTVEVAGWGTGYGNQIVINHGGGRKTRYGHLSKFFVSKGEEVSKGQTIGAMGSTGWSTGPHVHFEYIVNGSKLNPLNYIK